MLMVRGKADIQTGLGFFDHMLDQIARHGKLDLTVSVNGDLHIDEHHTIEDTAIALGEAFYRALADKRGMERYGFALANGRCGCESADRFRRQKLDRLECAFPKGENRGDADGDVLSFFQILLRCRQVQSQY